MGITVVEIVAAGPQGPAGTPGSSTHPGGLTKQVLMKLSGTDFHVAWDYTNALDTVFTSTTGIVSTNVEGAIDEVHTTVIDNGGRLDTAEAAIIDNAADIIINSDAIADNAADIAAGDVLSSANEVRITTLEATTTLDLSLTTESVDTVLTAGVYAVTDSNALPSSLTYGTLTVLLEADGGTDVVRQLLTATSGGVEYTRDKIGVAAFGAWMEDTLSAKVTNEIAVRSISVSTDDVDTLLLAGYYEVSTNTTSGNAGNLDVINTNNGTAIKQVFKDTSTGMTYTRSSPLGDGTDFTAWLVETEAYEPVNDFTIMLDTDNDTIVARGNYKINNTFTGSLPAGVSSLLDLEVIRYVNDTVNPNRVDHTLRDLTDGKKYTRTTADYNAPSWGAWVVSPRLATNSTVLDFAESVTTPAYLEGREFYKDGVKNIMGSYSDVPLPVGRAEYMEVVNNTGTTIPKGTVCRHNGVSGGVPQAIAAQAITFRQATILGMAAHDILSGQSGLLTTFGVVRGINTLGLTPGAPTYLSDITEGEMVSNPPSVVISQVGGVLVSDASVGQVFVSIHNNITLPTLSGFLQGAATPAKLISTTPTVLTDWAASGSNFITVSAISGTFTITTAGYYEIQTLVSLTGASSVSTPQDVLVQIFVNGVGSGEPFPLIIGRNGTRCVGTPFEYIDLAIDDVLDLRYWSDTTNGQTLNFELLSCSIKSIVLSV